MTSSRSGALLFALVLNQFVYPLTIRDAMLLRAWAFDVALARNLMLMLWAAAIFRPVFRPAIARDARASRNDLHSC